MRSFLTLVIVAFCALNAGTPPAPLRIVAWRALEDELRGAITGELAAEQLRRDWRRSDTYITLLNTTACDIYLEMARQRDLVFVPIAGVLALDQHCPSLAVSAAVDVLLHSASASDQSLEVIREIARTRGQGEILLDAMVRATTFNFEEVAPNMAVLIELFGLIEPLDDWLQAEGRAAISFSFESLFANIVVERRQMTGADVPQRLRDQIARGRLIPGYPTVAYVLLCDPTDVSDDELLETMRFWQDLRQRKQQRFAEACLLRVLERHTKRSRDLVAADHTGIDPARRMMIESHLRNIRVRD